jgi:hypothetical protein
MLFQRIGQAVRQHHPAILLPFAAADSDFAPLEVDVLDAERKTLFEAESTSVQQGPHQPGNAAQLIEDGPHFAGAQHDRHTVGRASPRDALERPDILAEHDAVKEQDEDDGIVVEASQGRLVKVVRFDRRTR